MFMAKRYLLLQVYVRTQKREDDIVVKLHPNAGERLELC